MGHPEQVERRDGGLGDQDAPHEIPDRTVGERETQCDQDDTRTDGGSVQDAPGVPTHRQDRRRDEGGHGGAGKNERFDLQEWDGRGERVSEDEGNSPWCYQAQGDRGTQRDDEGDRKRACTPRRQKSPSLRRPASRGSNPKPMASSIDAAAWVGRSLAENNPKECAESAAENTTALPCS